jgi:alkylhydroperoxidase family enzyme
VLGESRNVFSDVERAVIALANAITDTPSNVSDDLYAELRSHFTEEQLLELGAQISFENFRARLNRIYNAESDGLYKAAAHTA